VYTNYVKNITLSADEDLIEKARAIARAQRRTLNDSFREWLKQFAASDGDAQQFHDLMARLKHIDAGRRFTRDEMNER
jgi:predicted transcriptional regulator